MFALPDFSIGTTLMMKAEDFIKRKICQMLTESLSAMNTCRGMAGRK